MRRAGLLAGWRLCGASLVLACGAAAAAADAPRTPASDAEVLERLPYRALAGVKAQRPAPPASQPDTNPQTAVAQARHYMALTRERGDPRYAGYALAALRPWLDQAAPPPAVALMLAELDQYQHDFDKARDRLHALVRRVPAGSPIAPQAWLMLATLARLQGNYAESDQACSQVAREAMLYALACQAENQGLRGQADAARTQLLALLAHPTLQQPSQKDTRRWLLTTMAELEERAGHARAAEHAYRQALADMDPAAPDSYLVLASADFLLDQGRHKDALKQLASLPEPLSDPALLRRAIAARRLNAPSAEADARELEQRFAAQRARGDGANRHGREFALYALAVRNDRAAALTYARENLGVQKEPIDLLVMARAATAAQDREALRALAAQLSRQGLQDARIQRALAARP